MSTELSQKQQTQAMGTLRDPQARRRLPYPQAPSTVVRPEPWVSEVIVRLAALAGLAPGEAAAVLLDRDPLIALLGMRQKTLELHQRRRSKFEKWPARSSGSEVQNGFDGADERKPKDASGPPASEPAGQRQYPDRQAIRVPLSRQLNAQLYGLASSHNMLKSQVAAILLEVSITRHKLAEFANELSATPSIP